MDILACCLLTAFVTSYLSISLYRCGAFFKIHGLEQGVFSEFFANFHNRLLPLVVPKKRVGSVGKKVGLVKTVVCIKIVAGDCHPPYGNVL